MKPKRFKVGDIVTMPPKGAQQHRARGVVVKVTKKKVYVADIQARRRCHGSTLYRPEQLRFWEKGNRDRNKHYHG